MLTDSSPDRSVHVSPKYRLHPNHCKFVDLHGVECREYMEGAGKQQIQAELPAVRDIAMLIACFACNNHTICDEELRPIGEQVFEACKILGQGVLLCASMFSLQASTSQV